MTLKEKFRMVDEASVDRQLAWAAYRESVGEEETGRAREAYREARERHDEAVKEMMKR
jgi:hypothetical protein